MYAEKWVEVKEDARRANEQERASRNSIRNEEKRQRHSAGILLLWAILFVSRLLSAGKDQRTNGTLLPMDTEL